MDKRTTVAKLHSVTRFVARRAWSHGRPESEDVLVWQTARFEDYKYAARREPVGLVWSPMDKAELASRGYPEPTVQSGRTCFPN